MFLGRCAEYQLDEGQRQPSQAVIRHLPFPLQKAAGILMELLTEGGCWFINLK